MIVDASVAIKWVTNEEDSEQAQSLLTEPLSAPEFIYIECGNILWKKFRRSELKGHQIVSAYQNLINAPIVIVPDYLLRETALDMSLEIDHPFYDCLYLALAVLNEQKLLTADIKMINKVSQFRKYSDHIIEFKLAN
jgi:predicted nucleic acid-binding protein